MSIVYILFLYFRYSTDAQNNSVDGVKSNNETNTNEAESDTVAALANNSLIKSDNGIEKSSNNIETDEVRIDIKVLADNLIHFLILHL